MPEPSLELFDPHGTIESASETVREARAGKHETLAGLRDQLASSVVPRIALVDATASPPGDAEPGAELGLDEARSLHLVLVIVRDHEEGCRWLRRGATDFVVLREGSAELDARAGRLIRFRRSLVSRLSTEAEHAAYLRSIAHDVKNPLSAILGYVELFLEDPQVSGEMRDDLLQVQTNADAIRDVCDAIGDTVQELEALAAREVETA